MKLSLRLIAALVISICLVTFIVAYNQVRSEQNGLRAEMARRGQILTESLQETIEPALQTNSLAQLRRIVDRFDNRQHLAGVAVYDRSGKLLAASERLDSRAQLPLHVLADSREHDQALGEFATVGSTPMYVYALPLHYGTNGSGTLLTFHDATYITAQSARIWREALWHVVAEVLLVVLITLLIVRSTIVNPISKMSQWMKDLRAGKATPPPQVPPDFLHPLTSEAASLADSLAEARHVAKEEARLRDAGDAKWTPERLRAAVQRLLHGNPLYVVSNREPYHHVHSSKGIEVQVPASGLVTALEPVLYACDGTWIAHGSADADRETVDAHDRLRVPPDHPHYTLRRVWLTPEEESGYYFGFSNEGIWPLCHIAYVRPNFRATDWEHYKNVNEKFARAVLEEIGDAQQPFVLIQDYHFALLPRLIKNARPDARVAIFWHIPWPTSQVFRICPWQEELLDGLLGADLIGFHTQAHCNNFLGTVDESIECRIEWDRSAINRNGHVTTVRPLPISVASPEWTPRAGNSDTDDRNAILESLGPEVLFFGVGVDRVDYTKGIVERFHSIERFLEKNPQYLGRFSFVQFGAPSRTHIPSYQNLLDKVKSEAARINERFQKGRWKPVVLHSRHYSHKEIDPYYRTADLCMVTSLHDGMNLVAKEFVASRTNEKGVLILSEFTGAARALCDALLVNPYDIEQMADAISRAIEMPYEEQQIRMLHMRRAVLEHNVYRWAADLISELAVIRLETAELAEKR